MEIKEQIWTAHAEQKVKLSTQVKVEISDKVMNDKSQEIFTDELKLN